MKFPAFSPLGLFALTVTCVSSLAQSTAPETYYTTGPSLAAMAVKDPTEVGGPPRPELQGKVKSQHLQDAIGLSDEQTFKIERILTKEAADCQAMGLPPWPPASPIRQRARDDIRALLTPEQRAKFNLVPESHGGGLIGLSPWEQLDRLDKLVHLTPEQKQPVLEKLIDRTENLMETRGPEKLAERNEIRSVMSGEIRALLTPEQQRTLDASREKHRETSGDGSSS